MYHADLEKRKSTNDGRNRTTKSRENQNSRKKETYKYLGILKADAIKDERKKWKKEQENNSRQNYIAEISPKGQINGLSHLKDTQDHF